MSEPYREPYHPGYERATYLVPCRKCDGKGTTNGQTACDRCAGYGVVTSPSPIMDVNP